MIDQIIKYRIETYRSYDMDTRFMIKDDIETMKDILKSNFNKRNYMIIISRFLYDISITDIAFRNDLCRETIRTIIKRAIKIIRRYKAYFNEASE